MRIAQVAPLFESVPPSAYGGIERIVALLCDGLVQRGHDVTLFASGDSNTSARLVNSRYRCLDHDPASQYSSIAAHIAMLDEVRDREAEFDIVHCHISDFLHFPFFEDFSAKTLTTPHGRLDYPDLPRALQHWPDMPMSSISLSQRRQLPQANWIANIYHGLPVDFYQPAKPQRDSGGSGYLAFLGRFARDKRADRAIDIAEAVGMPLKLAARINEEDKPWFLEVIKPRLVEPNIEYIGEISDTQKSPFLAGAAALLFPIDWPEPFGLVAIEAMAHGTPVIAWRRGAMEEVIDEGVSGFVVDSLEEAVATVPKALALDRKAVRRCFERRFDVSRMVDEYIRAYTTLDSNAEVVGAPV